MGPEALYLTGSLALLCVGGSVAWVAFQVGGLVQRTRESLLPELTQAVKAVQENLSQLERLTRDADTTVQGANEIVAAAQRGVEAVERTASSVSRVVGHHASLQARVAAAGVTTAWRSYRARRRAQAAADGEQGGEATP